MLLQVRLWTPRRWTFLYILFLVTCRNFCPCLGVVEMCGVSPPWKWLGRVLMSSSATSFFLPGVFTNKEFAVLTRDASRVTWMACTKYIYFMGWAVLWVLIMHCQWTHVVADGFTTWGELGHLHCSEALSIPTQLDLLSAGFVWAPAQITSVGIWTNLTARGGWGVSSERWSLSWQAVLSPKLEGLQSYCLRLHGIFSEGFESPCDRIMTRVSLFFPLVCFWENSHSECRIPLGPVSSTEEDLGRGGGMDLHTKYSITETSWPPLGEIWNFKSPVSEFSPDFR